MTFARFIGLLLAGWFTVVAGVGAFAQFGSGMRPLSDPYYIPPYDAFYPGPFTNTSGYTPTSCAPGADVTKVIILPGQSLGTNAVNSTYSVTQAKNLHMNIYDGNCYQSQGILLGVFGSGAVSNLYARLGDKLIANAHGIDKVILVPMAVGSTLVSSWTNAQNAPYLYNQIAVVARRLAAQGLTATHVVWGQGELDNLAGTSQASYTASLNLVIAGFRSAGITGPFIVNQETWTGGATSAPVRAAQAAASGTNVFVGGDLDTVNNTGRYDTTHPNATGANTMAGLIETSVVAH